VAKEHKRGVFHTTEREFIKQNRDSMTVEQMAERLNRSTKAIENELLRIDGSYKQEAMTKEFERELKTRPYWKNLQKQYSKDELELVEYHWIRYIAQFKEDITHAEESQILKAIDLEIMLERVKLDHAKIDKSIEALEEALQDELDKDESLRDKQYVMNLNQQIMALRAGMSSGTKTWNELLAKHQDLMKALKSTRDQRLKDVETKDVTFYGWLKKMSDKKQRDVASRDAEMMKRAVGNLKKSFGEYYKYEDGELDRPLLNDETVRGDEEQPNAEIIDSTQD
jgi:hypothetical protein